MARISAQMLNECRVDLYDLCAGLAGTLQLDLADFAANIGMASAREIAAMRSGEPCLPISSIPRLAIIMLRLQDRVNAAYFRELQDSLALDAPQGELCDPSGDDDIPF
ncbi:hypothetical protein ABIE62_000905 [Porphyrobacter sp. MBR-155]|uniref:hypothetical protein n=1 Tax=Porphyrobacter sp. MBR-155 TaxID=3156464 RepID=UPI00339B4683